MDGLLLVDKPSGPTSHDVVARVRWALGGPKTGHFGTLDPLATGLLIVAVGQATRLNRFYAGRTKSYRALVRLGIATDTYDAEGTPGPVHPPPLPARAAVERALGPFRGEIEQVPPPFSAKKVGGTPLYRRARAGRPVIPIPAPVTIHDLCLLRYQSPDLDLEVRCSTGTYIRSLAHDLGKALGCGAYLASLRRTEVGEFRVDQAVQLSDWDGTDPSGSGLTAWIPMAILLPEWPRVDLDAAGSQAVRDGRAVPPDLVAAWSEGSSPVPARPDDAFIRVFDSAGRFAALARKSPDTGFLAPFLVFPAS